MVDQNIGLDIDITVRCHGEYAYRIFDPILFYKNVCGNFEEDFRRDRIDSQLKSEMMTALQPAFAKISAMGIRYSALPGHTLELANALNEVLADNWADRYGIEISSIGVNSIKTPEEDEEMIKELQKTAVFRNPGMAAAYMTTAQAEAMKAAASNKSTGPMVAFAGMNMAANVGGINAGQLFQMAGEQQTANQAGMGAQQMNQSAGQQGTQPMKAAFGIWTCSCGENRNTGKFCINCGMKKPEHTGFWTCSCGTQNKGKFCMECGKKKPADALLYKCDKCGWGRKTRQNRRNSVRSAEIRLQKMI